MPAGTPLINGVGYNWSQIDILIAGQPVYGITNIEYDDKQIMEDVYGAGQYPVERGEGKIECSAKIGLLMSVAEALQAKSPTGRLQDLGTFDIVVSFQPTNGTVATHTIKNAQFKDNSRKVKTGDTKVEIEYALITSHILWK